MTNNPGMEFAPSWSPTDPGQLAFSAERDGIVDIWVADLEERTERNLTQNDAGDFESDWSPDGTKLIFTSLRDGNGELYLINSDGSGLSRLTSDPAVDGQGTWVR